MIVCEYVNPFSCTVLCLINTSSFLQSLSLSYVQRNLTTIYHRYVIYFHIISLAFSFVYSMSRLDSELTNWADDTLFISSGRTSRSFWSFYYMEIINNRKFLTVIDSLQVALQYLLIK